MRLRFTAMLAALALVLGASPAWAQSQTGEIFGKVTDTSGAVLPGVTRHADRPVAAAAADRRRPARPGSFQFPRLNVGTYNVKFELAGFKTVIKEDIEVTVGFSANVEHAARRVGGAGNGHGHGREPDRRHQADRHEADVHARAAAEHSVGARSVGHPAADGGHRHGPREHRRQHVGPAVQLRVARRQPDQQQVVDRRRRHDRHGGDRLVVDLLRLRRVPGDDDQHRRRRRDAADRRRRHQPGHQERHRPLQGLGPLLQHQRRASSRTTSPTSSANQGATSGNPIQDIKDYGFEMGGPIKKGRAWVWGSYGKQDVKVGVINFYKPDAELPGDQGATRCATRSRTSTTCLNTDLTLLETTNLKGEVQLFKGNKLSPSTCFHKKERNARNASDTTPIESTQRQGAVDQRLTARTAGTAARTRPTSSATSGWSAIALLLDVQYAHVGNNFILDFHDPRWSTSSRRSSSPAASTAARAAQSVNIRPTNSLSFNPNYFMPGKHGRRPRVQGRRLLARNAPRTIDAHGGQRHGALPDRRRCRPTRTTAPRVGRLAASCT